MLRELLFSICSGVIEMVGRHFFLFSWPVVHVPRIIHLTFPVETLQVHVVTKQNTECMVGTTERIEWSLTFVNCIAWKQVWVLTSTSPASAKNEREVNKGLDYYYDRKPPVILLHNINTAEIARGEPKGEGGRLPGCGPTQIEILKHIL